MVAGAIVNSITGILASRPTNMGCSASALNANSIHASEINFPRFSLNQKRLLRLSWETVALNRFAVGKGTFLRSVCVDMTALPVTDYTKTDYFVVLFFRWQEPMQWKLSASTQRVYIRHILGHLLIIIQGLTFSRFHDHCLRTANNASLRSVDSGNI